ncbi:serine--tRNA ligase [soil metagenome]
MPGTKTVRYGPVMLDVRRLRREPDAVRAALARRSDAAVMADLERVVDLDVRLRRLSGERDDLRARIKAISRQVGDLRRQGDVAATETLQAESRALGERERALDAEHAAVAAEATDVLLRLPNLPSPDAPDGAGPSDNVVLRTHGHSPDAYGDHQRVPHWDIGTELGILDFERAARISGSMFGMYRGWGARLLRAMVALSLDRNGDAFEEIRPPTLVRTETMVSTGHLPKFADDAYHIERDDLWAIPTAEVPLTSLGGNEVFDESQLPLRFMAYTSCYRREAGSAGRDTRGLLRAHEFDKVELLAYAASEAQAVACQRDVLARAEGLLGDLGLGYRVVDPCATNLGGSAARTWDLEVYAPGCDLWWEVSSVSWFGDYQARRANIRFRRGVGKGGGTGTELCHTVNGSALGWPRTVAALLETHRRPDGSVGLPDVLGPYLVGATEIPAPAGPGGSRR